MSRFRINLLGQLHFETDCGLQVGIPGRKTQELLCYLLIFRSYPHARDKLATTLWEENPTDQSRRYLRRTLWQLHQAIEEKVEIKDSLLIVEPDWIQLNPQAPLWLDIEVLESAYQQVRGLPGEGLDRNKACILHDATTVYHGQLLEGWYETWCIAERERLQHIYLVMLDKLMRYCEAQGDLEAGIAYGNQILCCDRAREYTHRQLMRLFYFARDRSGALRQYERCLCALREELDVEPTLRTQLLYQQIRQDALSQSFSLRRDRGDLVTAQREQVLQLMTELEQLQKDLVKLNQSAMRVSELVRGLR